MAIQNAGLTTSLRTLVGALQANQSALSYISDNISNVSSTGYTRRVVSQEAQVSSGVGIGVNVTEVRRSIDEFLLKTMRAQVSKAAQSAVTDNYMQRLQQFSFGNPNSSFTINNTLNEFYGRLESLTNNPSSAVNRHMVVSSSQDFVNSLSELSRSVHAERYNADMEISDTITQLNSTLKNLYDINAAIRQAKAVGGDLNSLYDARDIQLNNVKSIIDADFSFDSYGQVSVNLASTELLGFTTRYQLKYDKVNSVDSFINNSPTNAITIVTLDPTGQPTSNEVVLLSSSSAAQKTDLIPGGKLRGLIDIRDGALSNMLQQLDMFAYTFANEFNARHNSGSGFPPAQKLTGTSAFSMTESWRFSGSSRLTVVDANGMPVNDRFGDTMPPLNIDFSRLNGANGFGTASVRDLMTEINSYYGQQPSTVANIGPAQDIRLAAVSNNVASASAAGFVSFAAPLVDGDTIDINGTTFTFRNVPTLSNDILIGGNLANTMQNLQTTLNNSTIPGVALATYSVSSNTLNIDYDLAGTNGNAFTIDASAIAGATASGATLSGGIDAFGDFTFDFDFANLASDGQAITFDVTQISINGNPAAPVVFNNYTQQAGDRLRTNQAGTVNDTLTTNLTGMGLQEGDSFTVTATIVVVDGDGVSRTEDVTFTVTIPDPNTEVRNVRYQATGVSGSGDGEIQNTINTSPILTAKLVDANGKEITDNTTPGFLSIETANSTYRFIFDQLNSSENGDPILPNDTGSGYGLSHLFGLNNFFTVGSSPTNAAINLGVRSDILSNPSLLSTGQAVRTTSTGTNTVYTYEMGMGANQALLNMMSLQNTNIRFGSTGGMPELSTTLNAFASEIYSYAASLANTASAENQKNTVLSESLQSKFDDISGVNLDEELGQTIYIQNAYNAAARVMSIVREMFGKLEDILT